MRGVYMRTRKIYQGHLDFIGLYFLATNFLLFFCFFFRKQCCSKFSYDLSYIYTTVTIFGDFSASHYKF